MITTFNIIAQKKSFNTTLISTRSVPENVSDIWGYDHNGIKYAIMGSATATNIFSLEDVKNPKLIYKAEGARSIWRDIKSYKNHLYATTDQGTDGLVIIDMTKAPDTITHTYFKPMLKADTNDVEIVLNTCHNIFIDENGVAYLAGCNVGKRGVIMMDLNGDPNEPTYLGAANVNYSHDAFARGDTLYSSEINVGLLTIYDVKDKANPVVLGSRSTSRNFTHNAWGSDDGKYVFTTDEKAGAYLDAYDITDPMNMVLLDKFRPLDRENDGVIPHNTHYYNGYLLTSWYTDGLRVVDAHKPDNLVEVAYYDTWEDPAACHREFSGCWGAFPYTGGNIVYASDINNGLFIIEVDYKRACYFEGKITNNNGTPIPNVRVEIVTDQINYDLSGPDGVFKTGIATASKTIAKFTHPDYLDQSVEIDLVNGETVILEIQMIRKRPFDVSFSLKNQEDSSVSGIVSLTAGKYNELINVNTIGELTKSVLTSDYKVKVASWGYKILTNPSFKVGEGSSNTFIATMEKGYEDDFDINLNWIANSTANMTGEWVRAKPRQTLYFGVEANPGQDSRDDGELCYVTGNGLPGGACDDIDNGVTTLTSPVMDLTTYTDPGISYDTWFYNAGGNSAINDTLIISMSNGKTEVVIDKVFGITNGWKSLNNLKINNYLDITNEMKLIVTASDISNSGHIVEAGFDNFSVKEIISSTKDFTSLQKIAVYPNPASNILIVDIEDKTTSRSNDYHIYNALGLKVIKGNLDTHRNAINIDYLIPGVYVMKINGFQTVKFIKE